MIDRKHFLSGVMGLLVWSVGALAEEPIVIATCKGFSGYSYYIDQGWWMAKPVELPDLHFQIEDHDGKLQAREEGIVLSGKISEKEITDLAEIGEMRELYEQLSGHDLSRVVRARILSLTGGPGVAHSNRYRLGVLSDSEGNVAGKFFDRVAEGKGIIGGVCLE